MDKRLCIVLILMPRPRGKECLQGQARRSGIAGSGRESQWRPLTHCPLSLTVLAVAGGGSKVGGEEVGSDWQILCVRRHVLEIGRG